MAVDSKSTFYQWLTPIMGAALLGLVAYIFEKVENRLDRLDARLNTDIVVIASRLLELEKEQARLTQTQARLEALELRQKANEYNLQTERIRAQAFAEMLQGALDGPVTAKQLMDIYQRSQRISEAQGQSGR